MHFYFKDDHGENNYFLQKIFAGIGFTFKA